MMTDIVATTKKRDDWENLISGSLHKLFTEISEKSECYNDIHVHKTQVQSAKACDVHRSTVQKVCNETSTSSTDHQGFASPRKEYGRKYATDTNFEES
jgi:hypothetical protein